MLRDAATILSLAVIRRADDRHFFGNRFAGRCTAEVPAKVYRFLTSVLILFGVVFLIARLGEGRQLLEVLRGGETLWIGVAVCLEALMRLNQAAFYHAIFRLFEVKLPFRRVLRLVLASLFAGLVAPGGTLSGTALIITACVRQGVEPARAMVANFVYFLLDYSAFGLVLTAGLVYLVHLHDLNRYEVWAAGLLAALVAGMILILGMAMFRPDALQRWGARLDGWLAGRRRRLGSSGVSDKRAAFWASELITAVRLIRTRPRTLWRPVIHALAVEILSILTLASVFLAFRYPVAAGVLIAGYTVGTLFMIVSITPSGIGFVEGAMTGGFVSLGVPLETAVVVTLVYRGISVWLPFLTGIWGMRVVAKE